MLVIEPPLLPVKVAVRHEQFLFAPGCLARRVRQHDVTRRQLHQPQQALHEESNLRRKKGAGKKQEFNVQQDGQFSLSLIVNFLFHFFILRILYRY